ncbi:GNAT family N-acetyltransferase [Methylobacterium sp. M6A4_1b]
MAPCDLEQVVALADRLFPDHPEEAAHFAERLALGAGLCLTLSNPAGDVAGYAVAYPWPLGDIPPLNTSPAPAPPAEGSAYLHDLGIDPALARSGHARAGLSMLVERVRRAGLRGLALVAVNRTAPFWQSQGFTICEASPAMAVKVASYGSEARYMIRNL